VENKPKRWRNGDIKQALKGNFTGPMETRSCERVFVGSVFSKALMSAL